MTWQNRVAWQEGMFLRAQHFQQQDRWMLSQLRAGIAAVRTNAWGLTELVVARELLGIGRFGLNAATGLFEDGTAFALPTEAALPPPLTVPQTARDVLVHLCLRVQLPGAAEIDHDGIEGRYAPHAFEASDTHSGAVDSASVQVGRLRLRLLLGTDDLEGYVSIPVARVSEVLADSRVVLDEGWIPPALTCSATPPLAALAVELAGLLNQRAGAIAGRLTATGARSGTEIADFMLLQSINGWQVLLAHLAETASLHPEELFRLLLQMAGELATFTEATRRPDRAPSYRHDDLQRSFAPLVAAIRRSLSAVLEQTAVQIPLQARRHGVSVGPITDRTLLTGTSIVLVAKADMPVERLRRSFPGAAKVGAVEQIRELVNVAMPGVELRPLPVAPRQMPYVPGSQYFELDRNSPQWQFLPASAGFAIHVSGDFPGLELELWAIRA